MKRWPSVTSVAAMPSTSKATTLPSKRQRMRWSGRTQRSFPEPQVIDLGQGKVRTIAPIISATTALVERPAVARVAK
jgi:hypothetical protein